MKPQSFFYVLFLAGGLLLSAAPAGIAAGEAPLNVKQIKKVKAGMTRDEVTALVGKPGKVEKKADGGEVWIYEHKEKKSSPPAPDLPYPQPEESRFEVRLKVVFDAKGVALDAKRKVLKEKHHSYLVPPDHVEPVKVDPAEQGS